MVGMDMRECMRELIMPGMRHMPERQPQVETAAVPRQRLLHQAAPPGHAAGREGPAIYTGRDIWLGSTPTTTVISRQRQGRLPRQQTGPLRLPTAAAPAITVIIAITAIIAAAGTIAATGIIAAPKIPAVWGYHI